MENAEFLVRDDRWSVDRIRAEAQAHLERRAAEPAAEPPCLPSPPRKPATPGGVFLYLARSGETVKIGYAANLYLRFSNIRVNNPHEAELAGWWEMPKPMALDVERFAHMAMQDRHAAGEWFTVPVAEALEHIERIAGIFRDLYRTNTRRIGAESSGGVL